MRITERKVPGGKLVRVKLDEKDGKITSVHIEGDFFVHPEEGLVAMESSLTGLRTDDAKGIRAALAKTMDDLGIILVGFSVEDIVDLIGGK